MVISEEDAAAAADTNTDTNCSIRDIPPRQWKCSNNIIAVLGFVVDDNNCCNCSNASRVVVVILAAAAATPSSSLS